MGQNPEQHKPDWVPSFQQLVGPVGRYLPITASENCLELWILAPPHTCLYTISGVQEALPRGPRAPNITPAEDTASPTQFTTRKTHSLKGLTATGSMQNPGELVDKS